MGGYGRWAAAHGTLGVRVVSLSGMEGEGLVGRWGVGVLPTIRLWLVLATVLQARAVARLQWVCLVCARRNLRVNSVESAAQCVAKSLS